MNPLKQGLKPYRIVALRYVDEAFIHESIKTRVETRAGAGAGGSERVHLSMNPLKQGLKPRSGGSMIISAFAFIHESIKTRVETKPAHR